MSPRWCWIRWNFMLLQLYSQTRLHLSPLNVYVYLRNWSQMYFRTMISPVELHFSHSAKVGDNWWPYFYTRRPGVYVTLMSLFISICLYFAGFINLTQWLASKPGDFLKTQTTPKLSVPFVNYTTVCLHRPRHSRCPGSVDHPITSWHFCRSLIILIHIHLVTLLHL